MEHKREYVYDFLRVISCFFIIFIHCADRFLQASDYNIIWWEYNITSAIVRTGLIIFVFISGSLLLNKKDERISTFYIKRFSKIIIPFLFYSYLYLFVNECHFDMSFFMPSNIVNSLTKIMSNPVNYHLWFVYMIVGFYLFSPFLKKMLQNLNDSYCMYLLILLYIVSFIKYFLPSFGINILLTNLLIIDWSIPFVLGYLSCKPIVNKHYKIIYLLGIFSFIFTIVIKRFIPDFQHLYDLSPTMLIESQAIFIFFLRNKDRICKSLIMNKLASFISTYIYEVYLIHAMIIDFLQSSFFKELFKLTPFFNMCIAVLLTFFLSFIIAFIVHNLIIKNLIRFFYFIIDVYKYLRNKVYKKLY